MKSSGIPFAKLPARVQKLVLAQDAKPVVPTPNLDRMIRQSSGTAVQVPVGHFAAFGLPEPEREHRFDPPRKWRFDFAWPTKKIALEVEGGVWTGGRHTRGGGFMKDMEKYNQAAIIGWRVVRCVPSEVKGLATIAMIERLLA